MSGMSHNDWRELLATARRGHADALGQLLDQYRGYLRLLAEHHLRDNPLAANSASDAVQDVFAKAHANFDQFRGECEAELTGWLRRILATCLVNVARRQYGRGHHRHAQFQRLSERLDASSESLAAGLFATDSTPEQRAIRRERSVLFANAFERLPEHYRQVLLLRHFDELSFPEVAERMNRSVDSVQKLWARALDSLRRLLHHESDE
jgi:RNA polymerase sigma-70 factor (ECF subfamily)